MYACEHEHDGGCADVVQGDVCHGCDGGGGVHGYGDECVQGDGGVDAGSSGVGDGDGTDCGRGADDASVVAGKCEEYDDDSG